MIMLGGVCAVCGLQFSKSSSLKKDMESVHADEFVVLFQVAEILITVETVEGYQAGFEVFFKPKNHKKNEHPHQESHSCTQCDKVFKNMKRLSSHVSAGYSEQIFQCLCAKQFGDKQATLQQAGKNSEAACELRDRQRWKRFKKVAEDFEERMKGFSMKETKTAFKKLVKTIMVWFGLVGAVTRFSPSSRLGFHRLVNCSMAYLVVKKIIT